MWAMFLPLGRHGSVDAYHAAGRFFPKKPFQESVNDRLPIIGFALLAAALLLVAAYSKVNSADWYKHFNTLYYVLNTGYHTTPIGHMFRNQVVLGQILTVLTLVIEWVAGAIILIPFKVKFFRTIFSLSIIFLMTGFEVMMIVSHFPLMTATMAFLFMPSYLWDFVAKIKRFNRPVTTAFKRVATVTAAYPVLTFRPSNKDVQKVLSGLLSVFIMFNICLQVVANADEAIGWNMGHNPIEQVAKKYMKTMRIDQWWFMFSNAPHWSGWPEVVVTLENGDEKDIWRKQWQGTYEVSTEGPDRVSKAFLSSLRYFNYQTKMAEYEKHGNYHLYYGFYICKNWSENNELQSKKVDYYYNYSYWHNIGEVEKHPRKLVWSYECPEFPKEAYKYVKYKF